MIAVGSSAHRLLKTADIDALMRPGPADPPMGTCQRGRYQMHSYQTAKLAVTACFLIPALHSQQIGQPVGGRLVARPG